MFNRPTKADKVNKGRKFSALCINPEEVNKGNNTKKSDIFQSRLSDLDKKGQKLEKLLSISAPTHLDKIDALKISLEIFLMVARLVEIDTAEETNLINILKQADNSQDLDTLRTLQAKAEKVAHHY